VDVAGRRRLRRWHRHGRRTRSGRWLVFPSVEIGQPALIRSRGCGLLPTPTAGGPRPGPPLHSSSQVLRIDSRRELALPTRWFGITSRSPKSTTGGRAVRDVARGRRCGPRKDPCTTPRRPAPGRLTR
jgi:hypothetical protein